MRKALEYIAEKKASFAQHSFFRLLGKDLPLEQVAAFVPEVAFFVFAFQDLAHMLSEQANDPRVRDLLHKHGQEEVGHDQWFLRDTKRLVGAAPDVQTLFGPRHAPARLATYQLFGEAFQARSDFERLCLILTLEATGEVCFGAAQAYFNRVGVGRDLLFFAGPHLAAEQEHTVFEENIQAVLRDFNLDEVATIRANAVIDRAYAAFVVMLDGLSATIAAAEAVSVDTATV